MPRQLMVKGPLGIMVPYRQPPDPVAAVKDAERLQRSREWVEKYHNRQSIKEAIPAFASGEHHAEKEDVRTERRETSSVSGESYRAQETEAVDDGGEDQAGESWLGDTPQEDQGVAKDDWRSAVPDHGGVRGDVTGADQGVQGNMEREGHGADTRAGPVVDLDASEWSEYLGGEFSSAGAGAGAKPD